MTLGLNMYAKVIPAVRLPKSFGEYDYAVPEQYRAHVQRGSWVVVPWRGRPVDALVTAVTKKPAIDPSKVKEMIGFGALQPVDEDLIRIPELISRNCFVSPTSAVKAFLPVTPKTKVITEVQKSGSSEVQKFGDSVNQLIIYDSPREKLARALKLVTEATKNGSVIVITPHRDEVEPLVQALRKAITEIPVVPLHGAMTGPALRRAWQQLLAEPKAIAVGTRLTALAPVHRPALFLILEADSADLRQYDQNPRYDARDVARWRAESSGAAVALLSHAPRLEEYILAQNDDCKLEAAEQPNSAILIDIAGNPRGSDNPLSPAITARIEDSLRTGKKVLLFHNRLGSAGALFCRDCGRVFRCPACKIAVTVLERTLRCGRCGLEGPTPTTCPDCSSANLGQVGLGTEAMVPALQQIFPEQKIDSYDSAKPTEERGRALQEADIVIGTRLLLHDVAESGPSDCWGCIVATDLDELLSHPGFRVTEDAWRTVRIMQDIAQTADAELLLQTVDPENPKIRRLLDNFETFMAREAEDRRLVGYPPSGELITITVRADNAELAERSAKQFRTQAEQAVPGITLAGPLRHSRPYRDGKWRSVIAIKTATISEPLTALLKSLPKEYIIDRNPESVG